MILIVDNFDSFTYNLVDYFEQLEQVVNVQRNTTAIEQLIEMNCDALVLSPGPGQPREAGKLMQIIDYFHNKLPILGICLGHQAIAAYFNAALSKAIRPMHGKISHISLSEDPIFCNMPTHIDVVRYHSLVCSRLPKCLHSIAMTNDGENMAIRHERLPIYGLQFHPEALLTQYGLDILRNWINFVLKTTPAV